MTDGVFVHTNHYLSGLLKPLELPADRKDSRWRHKRLAANFAALRGPITADDCWRQLADNTRGDGAVCNEEEFAFQPKGSRARHPARRAEGAGRRRPGRGVVELA